MCGFTGLYHFGDSGDKGSLRSIAERMADAIRHRGPDSGGAWADPDVPYVTTHRRLSILDLSPEGHQPMLSKSGRYVVSYNGEIYNYLEIQRELEQLGATFRGRSDTEVLLEAIDRWGVGHTLQKINGMFAIALWDRQRRQLHLIRDRLGKKPLYVGWAGETLVFGSELKALRAHPAFEARVARKALTLYMRYACVPAPFSIYRHVWSLPAGHLLVLSTESLDLFSDLSERMEPYWSHAAVLEEARQKRDESLSDAQAAEELETLLQDCVKERMISDVPVGAFLSGGIDSSLVVALMQRVSARPVKTFSIGFHETGFDEAVHARRIAEHLETDHHELYLSAQDALDMVPDLPRIYDEPFADPSQIPTCMVSRFARESVTVALSGDGGDEMFGGYQRHYMVPAIWSRLAWMPVPLRRALGRMIRTVPQATWDRLVPSHPQFGTRLYKASELVGRKSPQEAYSWLIGHWHEPEKLVLGGFEPVIPLTDRARMPKNLSFAETMMYGDALSYLPNDILVKVDRASMASSLEARAPLLDPRLYRHAWSLPHRMKVRDGKGKWLLRQVLSRYVPRDMFERPKQGFAIPQGAWMRGALKGWAEDLLSPAKLRREGFLDVALVRKAWEEHQKGIGGHDTRLWNVLMFQSWLEHWKV